MAFTNRRQPRMLAPRRRSMRPVMLVLVLLTLVVLAVYALDSSGPTEREQRQETLAYLDKVRPLIERSSSTGKDIARLRTDAVTLGRDGLERQLTRAEVDADGVVTDARAIRPPTGTQTANDILVGLFASRASAVHALKPALLSALAEETDAVKAVQALIEVGNDVEGSDAAYRTFRRSLPPEAAAALPDSEWTDEENGWSAPVLGALVSALRNSAELAPVHDVAVLVATPTPAPVGKEEGPLLVLPDVRTIEMQIVVANKGNTEEKAVEVTVTLQPLDGSRPSTKRELVDLRQGQNKSFSLKSIPTPGVDKPFSLSVRIGPVAGDDDPTDDEIPRNYVMRRGPGPNGTTTSTEPDPTATSVTSTTATTP